MIRTDIYIHSSKESMYEKGVEIGLKGEALRRFVFAASEVKLTIDVDAKNGKSSIVAVDDKPLSAAKTNNEESMVYWDSHNEH